jgi:hypothetical protein
MTPLPKPDGFAERLIAGGYCMKKVIVSVMMLAVLMVGSVAGAAKGGVNGSEHGSIVPFENGSIWPVVE